MSGGGFGCEPTCVSGHSVLTVCGGSDGVCMCNMIYLFLYNFFLGLRISVFYSCFIFLYHCSHDINLCKSVMVSAAITVCFVLGVWVTFLVLWLFLFNSRWRYVLCFENTKCTFVKPQKQVSSNLSHEGWHQVLYSFVSVIMELGCGPPDVIEMNCHDDFSNIWSYIAITNDPSVTK